MLMRGITHLALDYGSTLTVPDTPPDLDLGMRPLDPLVIPALKRAREGQLTLVLASNTRKGDDRHRALERAGILNWFGPTLESAKLRVGKPHPAFYQTLIAITGARPEQVLFIGDNLANDVIAPIQHGIPAALVRHPALPEKRRIPLPPALEGIVPTISHVSELIPLLGL
ncbi:HAD family hydrolase [Streptosporangium sp. NPDC020072]|uniref:HAD family hydrolase n=1 Tax=Streptosporangium sp. NPDC020072 TaxID=3154788 RepID=UPI0034316F8E